MTTEQSIWTSAKNFFFRSPLTISTESTEKPRKSSVVSSAPEQQQQQKKRQSPPSVVSSSDAYFLNNYGSLNLP